MGSGPHRPRSLLGMAYLSVAAAIAITLLEINTALVGSAVPKVRLAVALGMDPLQVLGWRDAIQFLILPLLVVAYFATCLFLRRARINTLVLDPSAPHERGAIWVWLGWLVPIVSWWYPSQVVRDIQNGSSRTGPVVNVTLWWGAWLVWLVVGRVASGLVRPRARSMGPGSMADPSALEPLGWIAALAMAVACVQWCRLVHGITTAQRESLALRDREAARAKERPAPPPAWDWRR